jgi:hypothetical protein
MRLNKLRDEYRNKGQDLGIGEKAIEADDVRYALGKMRELEPNDPKWRWAKGDASFRR